jgi:hypothetical protein
MRQQNELPGAADREELLRSINAVRRFLNPNERIDMSVVDGFARGVDRIVAYRDLHHRDMGINVEPLTDFKEMVLEGLRAAAAQSRPWTPTPEVRLAAAKAHGTCNRIETWLGRVGKDSSPAAPARQKRRGRKPGTDPKADRRIADAWRTGSYKEYKDLAREVGMSEREVGLAIDRDRHRRR